MTFESYMSKFALSLHEQVKKQPYRRVLKFKILKKYNILFLYNYINLPKKNFMVSNEIFHSQKSVI